MGQLLGPQQVSPNERALSVGRKGDISARLPGLRWGWSTQEDSKQLSREDSPSARIFARLTHSLKKELCLGTSLAVQ